MRLYTIQEEDFWKKCQDLGGIFIERQFIDEEFFLRSYEWMRRQMAKRLPAYSGDFPVWAWAERPDLRTIYWNVKGYPFFLLTIEVPADRVLLSDFGDWHIVLNDGYLPIDDADFEREWESPATQEEKEASWERIFDVYGQRYDSDGRIQACVDRVYLHEVISVRPFKSRGPNPDKVANGPELVAKMAAIERMPSLPQPNSSGPTVR